MSAGMTQQSLNALQIIQNLSDIERRWVIEAIMTGVDVNTRVEILRSLQMKIPSEEAGILSRPTYENVKNILLDEPDLSTADKVVLAAFAICDLYELKEFSGRQVTEFLKETSNEIGNVTAAMSALVLKGFAEIVSKGGESQQAQKRYVLTPGGIAKTQSLLQSSRPSGARVMGTPSNTHREPITKT